MTGVAKNTVTRLLVDLGAACSEYQDRALRGLNCKTLQVDEIWSFIGAKQKNVPPVYEDMPWMGDVWTWVAIDADTKLVPSFWVGNRTGGDAMIFLKDIASRLSNRIQLSSDGHKTYICAVPGAFGEEADYGIVHKIYGTQGGNAQERRYSPAVCVAAERRTVIGEPDTKKISTSYVERQNLTMRMSMRRFTRLTNAFSKKVENHAAAVALHFMCYNFCRKHLTLGTSPAMAAGVTDHVWDVEEMVALLETKEQAASVGQKSN